MTKNIFIKQRLFKNWIILLQDTICYEFEKIEKIFADATNQKPKFFKKNTWLKSQHKNEGGGNFNTLKNRVNILISYICDDFDLKESVNQFNKRVNELEYNPDSIALKKNICEELYKNGKYYLD